jgi:hypothetical protein
MPGFVNHPCVGHIFRGNVLNVVGAPDSPTSRSPNLSSASWKISTTRSSWGELRIGNIAAHEKRSLKYRGNFILFSDAVPVVPMPKASPPANGNKGRLTGSASSDPLNANLMQAMEKELLP